jgi:hypothetical protein
MGAPKKDHSVPRPRWPDVPCPEGSPLTAADHLHVIVFRAFAACAFNRSRILVLALRCASHAYRTNLPPEAHCRQVLKAGFHADLGAWDLVAEQLDH